jgi:hypothetical protein
MMMIKIHYISVYTHRVLAATLAHPPPLNKLIDIVSCVYARHILSLLHRALCPPTLRY